ncbi:MAG: protein kinase domain-containing protein, partial [Gemmatirosa sp.]
MLSTACPRCGAESAPNARFCSGCGQGLEPEGPATGDDHLLQRLRAATLGDYDVIKELGRGGMAAVYLAWDVELARYVAIKAMYPELATRDAMPQRFLQEARTAANLDDHPNVVRVYRAKESQGLRFFVMKYIDGCSLEQLLHAVGPLPLDVACFVVEQVARALHYAHDRGVVHRDMKPANVMLDRAGGVTVTDFGIAKVAQTEQLTRTGFAIGTPGYMSPEQWRVESLTSASDQYALGTVAYELLTGTPPFTGSLFEMQQRHLLAVPQPLRARRPEVPAELEATVLRMLAKEPADRWPSLAAVAGAMQLERHGGADAMRTTLAALLPRALGTEARGPYTPQSPVPVGRATPAESPAPPLPEPPRAPALQATTLTPAPAPRPAESAPVTPPVTEEAPRRRVAWRTPLLAGGALAAVALVAVLAQRDRSGVRTPLPSTDATPPVVSNAAAV